MQTKHYTQKKLVKQKERRNIACPSMVISHSLF